MNAYDVILRPVLSEKSTELREGDKKKYVFEVSPRATKRDIIQAIETIYSVKPEACKIINVKGRVKNNRPVSKTTFRRGQGKSRSWKKAIVCMSKGKAIDKFEGV